MFEVLKKSQCWEWVDGEIKFAYTAVFFRQDDTIFSATSPQKFDEEKFDLAMLENIKPVSPQSDCPPLPPNCAIAPSSDRFYVKKPNLTYCGKEDLASLILRELSTCEIIRYRPHKNIATYYGCQVSDGRITGLCFEEYQANLMDRINPRHLNKTEFILSKDRIRMRKKAAKYLSGIEEGIKHLHKLGKIHNDINPSNIMISDNDTPVIIDFDSSCTAGTVLDRTKRTYGWFNPDVCVSQESNDFDALAELRVWLVGSSPEEFQLGVY